MDRMQETDFAWALFDAATFLTGDSRTMVSVSIGADDARAAVRELLEAFMRNRTPVPSTLTVSSSVWINGFLGTDSDTGLRDLLTHIQRSHELSSQAG